MTLIPLRAWARSARIALTAVALSLVAGCADFFGPPPAPVAYVLLSLDEQALPALLESGPFHAVFLDADTLLVAASGAVRWIRHQRMELDTIG